MSEDSFVNPLLSPNALLTKGDELDPDATLDDILQTSEYILVKKESEDLDVDDLLRIKDSAEEMSAKVQALHKYISKGGSLPTDWMGPEEGDEVLISSGTGDD